MPIEIGNKARELEARLSPLLAQWGLRSVVLADSGGFPIVVAGDPLAQEGLAAFSALVSDVGQRACYLLPFGDVRWVNWVDVNGMAVSCRLFSLGQEDFAVAAIGPEGLDLPRADELVAVLQQILTSPLAPGEGSENRAHGTELKVQPRGTLLKDLSGCVVAIDQRLDTTPTVFPSGFGDWHQQQRGCQWRRVSRSNRRHGATTRTFDHTGVS